MSALTAPRDTPRMGNGPIPVEMGGNIDTTKTFFAGQLIAFNPANQQYTPAAANPTFVTVGVYTGGDDTIAPTNSPPQTFIRDVRQGVFKLNAGTGADAIPSTTPPGTLLYVIDDQTVGLTSNNGGRPPAGKLVQVDASGLPGYDGVPGVWVEVRNTLGNVPGMLPPAAPATNTVRPSITLRGSWNAPGAGAQDVVLIGANNLPAKLRVLDVMILVSTAQSTQSGQLRDTAAGGGNALSSSLSVGATGTVRNNDTATRLATPSVSTGLFFHLSDGTSSVGEVIVTVAPEI